MGEAVYQKDTKYILWIRDPLTRYVSAFNWVHEIVTNSDKVSGYNLQKEAQHLIRKIPIEHYKPEFWRNNRRLCPSAIGAGKIM